MKNLLALIGLVVVLVAGGGWYLGWYKIGTQPASDGIRKINVDVNTGKIKESLSNGQKKVGELLSSDGKGTTVTPTIPTPEKKVEGQPTVGLKITPEGASIILPPLNFRE